jgi:hypothetical protein
VNWCILNASSTEVVVVKEEVELVGENLGIKCFLVCGFFVVDDDL